MDVVAAAAAAAGVVASRRCCPSLSEVTESRFRPAGDAGERRLPLAAVDAVETAAVAAAAAGGELTESAGAGVLVREWPAVAAVSVQL